MKRYYKAIIKEKDGKIESIAYECNQKDKCNNSELCGKECQYTLNKDCAIDIGVKSDRQVIETRIYVDGELKKKIIEYK